MNKDTNQADTDKSNHKIEGDRDIPLVAQNTDYTKLGVIAFLLVGTIGIAIIVMDAMNKNQPRPMTNAEEVEFKAPVSAGKPYIEIIDKQEPKAEKTHNKTSYDAKAAQYERQMQQEALRLAKEQQRRLQKRLHSNQLIYDNSSSSLATNAPSPSSQSSSTGNFFGGGDKNLEFANQYARADVDTNKATQLQNLSALITQGTMIDGILETAIQSDLPGMIRAIVSEDVYSFDHSNLLIPKGSRLIGRYNSALVRGQSRVFVIWNRLIRNDGVSINIGSHGTDDLGRSGLEGDLDTHFFERFGSSILLSLIDASIQIGVNSIDDKDTATVAINTGNDFSRAAEIALENSIGIKPTININQGVRIKVFVGKDLDFADVTGNMRGE